MKLVFQSSLSVTYSTVYGCYGGNDSERELSEREEMQGWDTAL